MRLNRRLSRTLTGLLGLGLAGCEEPTGFARVERQTEIVASFQRQTIEGRARVEYVSTVPGGKDHPEFLVNWSNLNTEVKVELYVFLRSAYVDSLPPMQLAEDLTAQQKQNPDGPLLILWPQLPLEGPQFGDRLPTQLHLHPSVAEWVLVFYNPLDRNLANRALISGSIEMSYFSLP